MRKYIALLLLLSGCASTGQSFIEPNTPSIVLYRPATTIPQLGRFSVQVNGVETCELRPDGFYIIPFKNKIDVSATKWSLPETSRITVKKPSYIRIEQDQGRQTSVAIAGAVGYLAADAVSDNSGPFVFTNISPEQAKEDLKKLHQGCI